MHGEAHWIAPCVLLLAVRLLKFLELSGLLHDQGNWHVVKNIFDQRASVRLYPSPVEAFMWYEEIGRYFEISANDQRPPLTQYLHGMPLRLWQIMAFLKTELELANLQQEGYLPFHPDAEVQDVWSSWSIEHAIQYDGEEEQ